MDEALRFPPPASRRGRKTKGEEARAYLREQGIDPSFLDEERESVDIPEPEQMFAEFQRELYRQMKGGVLTGTALVNGLKAVAALAETAQQQELVLEESSRDERDISDVLRDAGLPAARRVEIGRVELERLSERAAALRLVVSAIEEET